MIIFLAYYIYNTHYKYVRRFINVHLGQYSFLHDDDEAADVKRHSSRNMLADEDGYGDLEDTRNPLITSPYPPSPNSPLTPNLIFEESTEEQQISALGITKAGYLLKQTTNMQRNWVRRWFFIKDGYLYYSRSHTDVISQPPPPPQTHSPGLSSHPSQSSLPPSLSRESSAKETGRARGGSGGDAGRSRGISNSAGDEIISAVLVSNLMISSIKTISDTEFHVVSPGVRGVGTGGGVYALQGESAADARDWTNVIKQEIENYLARSLDAPASLGQGSNRVPSAKAAGNVFYENKLHSSSSLSIPSKETLQVLYQANPYCVDCNRLRPDWASINLCVMMCIDCAGIHRKLGAHISKVRSLKLDKWSPNLVSLLVKIGNERANEMWEKGEAGRGAVVDQGKLSPLSSVFVDAPLPPLTPAASNSAAQSASNTVSIPPVEKVMNMKEREEYIRSKYEFRSFVNRGVVGLGIDANMREMQYRFLMAAKDGDLLTLMRGLVWGVDVNFIITTDEGHVTGGEAGVGSTPNLSAISSPAKVIPVNMIVTNPASVHTTVSHIGQWYIYDTLENHALTVERILAAHPRLSFSPPHSPSASPTPADTQNLTSSLLDMTALMLSVRYGHIICAELLLLWQANLTYRNVQGLTARDVLTVDEPSRSEILEILTQTYEARQY